MVEREGQPLLVGVAVVPADEVGRVGTGERDLAGPAGQGVDRLRELIRGDGLFRIEGLEKGVNYSREGLNRFIHTSG